MRSRLRAHALLPEVGQVHAEGPEPSFRSHCVGCRPLRAAVPAPSSSRAARSPLGCTLRPRAAPAAAPGPHGIQRASFPTLRRVRGGRPLLAARGPAVPRPESLGRPPGGHRAAWRAHTWASRGALQRPHRCAGLTCPVRAPQVIQRIFYTVNRSWSGRITCAELRRSTFLQVRAMASGWGQGPRLHPLRYQP